MAIEKDGIKITLTAERREPPTGVAEGAATAYQHTVAHGNRVFTDEQLHAAQQPIPAENLGTEYVLGFVFNEYANEELAQVLLLLKHEPAWQRGYYNGVGGKIEVNETKESAMIRELFEETGFDCVLYKCPPEHVFSFTGHDVNKKRWTVHVFRIQTSLDNLHTFEWKAWQYEPVKVFPVTELGYPGQERVIFNVRWMVPMLADRSRPDAAEDRVTPAMFYCSILPGVEKSAKANFLDSEFDGGGR